jgi:hypothetical protein
MAIPDPGDAKEFVYRERACQLGAAESCYLAGRMSGVGRGAPKSLEREVALGERGCELGSKEACALAAERLRVRPLAATDPNGRRAEALFARAGDVHAVATVLYDRVGTLCASPLPKGKEACVDALRAYRDAIDKDTTLSDDDQERSYHGTVYWACQQVQFEDCAKYPAPLEDNTPTNLP